MLLTIYDLDDISGKPVCSFGHGEHVIGRGEPLKCSDKRISRKHAQIDVSENAATITAKHHINPCFYRAAEGNHISILKYDRPVELSSGDKFGFFPDKYWFQIKITATANGRTSLGVDENLNESHESNKSDSSLRNRETVNNFQRSVRNDESNVVGGIPDADDVEIKVEEIIEENEEGAPSSSFGGNERGSPSNAFEVNEGYLPLNFEDNLHTNEVNVESNIHANEANVRSNVHTHEVNIGSNVHTNETNIGSNVHTSETHIGSNVHTSETNIGSTVHTNETNIGSHVHTSETNIGSNVHTNETNIGSNVHTSETNIGSNVHTNETNIESNIHTNETNIGSNVQANEDNSTLNARSIQTDAEDASDNVANVNCEREEANGDESRIEENVDRVALNATNEESALPVNTNTSDGNMEVDEEDLLLNPNNVEDNGDEDLPLNHITSIHSAETTLAENESVHDISQDLRGDAENTETDSSANVQIKREPEDDNVGVEPEVAAADDNDEDEADPNAASTSGAAGAKVPRDRCWYGATCYRKNDDHRLKFSHPNDKDYDTDPDDPRPSCSYGGGCYRRNKDHRKNFQHSRKTVTNQQQQQQPSPPSPKKKRRSPTKTRKRKAKKTTDKDDVGDAGDGLSQSNIVSSKRRRNNKTLTESPLDDYDLNDPFLDDSSDEFQIDTDASESDDDSQSQNI